MRHVWSQTLTVFETRTCFYRFEIWTVSNVHMERLETALVSNVRWLKPNGSQTRSQAGLSFIVVVDRPNYPTEPLLIIP